MLLVMSKNMGRVVRDWGGPGGRPPAAGSGEEAGSVVRAVAQESGSELGLIRRPIAGRGGKGQATGGGLHVAQESGSETGAAPAGHCRPL